MINFKNKKIIITGATGGIGNSLVEKFYNLDGSVLATGTNEEKLDSLKKKYPNIKILKFDISDHSKIEGFIDSSNTELSGLDILVNNAGITQDNLSLRMKDDEWNKVVHINLSSTFLLCKFAIKKMLKNKFGRIINITSISGLMGNPGQVNYSSSKAALTGFTKSLAKEVGSRNITVNSVAPGFIETDMTSFLEDETRMNIIKNIPLGRIGKVDDVSELVMFLASDEASYITGQTISVDGGLLMY